ncbi:peptidylprolyl isomerase [Paenibacillus sp. IHB B 3084]|uniref:peptidylprolyl isomerase n=1 Tax=Paenibacillus sp. IHB B 3084 TaxID=867076 RepID=UPI00071FEF17|nr:peptidylprolyl isomerase [Paenibacillus sp. IHB B 3084]ALP36721.1 peptidylprolyl isomerase [Paenibacillus sp. IHB B 3084]
MSQPNKRKPWRMLSVAIAAVLAISVLAACTKQAEESKVKDQPKDSSKVVVTYTGGTITENEFNQEISMMKFLYPEYGAMLASDQVREQIAKQEVVYKLLAEKADDKSKEQGAKEGTEQLEQYKKSVGDAKFKTFLSDQKLTEQGVKDYFTRVMTVINSETNKVTDDQLKQEFEKNKDQFTTATVRHVLINFQDPKTKKERKKEDALKLAKEVKAKLDGGADFATIAKKYSEDPGSASNGGLYENASVAQWVPAFKEAAEKQQINKIGDPVETEYGYHVIKVESRNEPTFDKLKDNEKAALKNKLAGESIQNFTEKDLAKLDLKINLPKVPATQEKSGTTSGTGSTTAPGGTTSGTSDTKAGTTKDGATTEGK